MQAAIKVYRQILQPAILKKLYCRQLLRAFSGQEPVSEQFSSEALSWQEEPGGQTQLSLQLPVQFPPI